MMSPSMSLKDRISSPLEAGTSIADGYQLPNRLTSALEYASKRLLRKETSVTLLAVQRAYQLPASAPAPSSTFASPAIASPVWSPLTGVPSGNNTPTRYTFASSTLKSLKQLVRSSMMYESPIRERIIHVDHDQFRNDVTSPAFSDFSMSSASSASTALTSDSLFSHRLRWPASPASISEPQTPATPFTIASSLSTTDTASTVSGLGLQQDELGIRFVYVGSLSPREEHVVRTTLEKTARKFKIGLDWLSSPMSPAALGIPADVVQRSVAQNEMLFVSGGLIVLSLDHLYTFRTALQSYTRTQSSSRLEDAVDELRRLILANGRQMLRKSSLTGAYRWLDPVSSKALDDVCQMYGRAYGGIEGECGVDDDMGSKLAWPLPEPEAEPQARRRKELVVDEEDSQRRHAIVVEESIATPTFESIREKLGGNGRASPPSTVLSTPNESPRLMPAPEALNKEVGDGLFDRLLRSYREEEQLEMEAIEAWYRQVPLQPVDILSPMRPESSSYPAPESDPITPVAVSVPAPKVTLMPHLGAKPGDTVETEAREAPYVSTTPKPTPTTTPKPIQVPAQETKAPQTDETEQKEIQPLSTTPKPIPTSTPQPTLRTKAAEVIEAELRERQYFTITPKLSPPPNGRNKSPLQGRERSPVLRLQTNFDSPSPRGSPQPVSAPQPVSVLSTGTSISSAGSSGARLLTEIDTPIPELLVPDTLGEEEEQLTARPRSAVATQPPIWWSNNPSIDDILRSPVTAVEAPLTGLPIPSIINNHPNTNPNTVNTTTNTSTTKPTINTTINPTINTAIRNTTNTTINTSDSVLPLTPLPLVSPITPSSAIPIHRGVASVKYQAFGPLTPIPLTPIPLTPIPLTPMARFEASTPRQQSFMSPLTSRPSSFQQGPMTPHEYDDISPITRGEWGFLMGGGGFGRSGKQARVGTVEPRSP